MRRKARGRGCDFVGDSGKLVPLVTNGSILSPSPWFLVLRPWGEGGRGLQWQVECNAHDVTGSSHSCAAAQRTTASDNGGTEEELMELKERFKNLMVPHPPCRGSPSGSSQRSNGSPHQIYTSPTGRHYLGPGSSKSDSPRTEFKAAPTVFSWTDPSGEEEVAMVWEGYTDAGRADAPARPRRSAVSSQVLQVEETEIFEPRVCACLPPVSGPSWCAPVTFLNILLPLNQPSLHYSTAHCNT